MKRSDVVSIVLKVIQEEGNSVTAEQLTNAIVNMLEKIHALRMTHVVKSEHGMFSIRDGWEPEND